MPDLQLNYQHYTITLHEKDGQYVWIRDDGEHVSPILTSEKQAKEYAKRMPLITEEEWK